ncbi:MAG: extracellular solute-binding protein [Alphaproteobacteria bacterium]|nr:extracellular solute-binding protein [Alphaproteobacteria bacterium]
MRRTHLSKLAFAASLALAVSLGTSGAFAQAKPEKLVIMSHAVHKGAVTGEKGGDSSADWSKKNGVGTEWLTFGVEAVHERVYREASLAEGKVDIAFILERYSGPQVARLFEDLSQYQAKDPIEDFNEISSGMRTAHTHNGKLIAIPFRHATHGLLYNQVYFKERGVDAPPKTMEALLALAEKMNYTRPDGTVVHGYITSFDDPSGIVDLMRAFGGDFITSDYKFVADSPASIKVVTLLRDFFRKGIFPKNVFTFKTEEVITMMQQGRAAMTNQPFGRFFNYNDAKQSKFPGEFKVTTIPAAGGGIAPAKTSVWGMAIPANSKNKQLAWTLIKELSSKKATVAQAINGNGPVRVSAYKDEGVRKLVPYADDEAAVLQTARSTVPGFENTQKAMDFFMEEIQLAMLGTKTPEQAMADLKKRVEPLLPR